jgi:formate dehydrogenase subunit gamma
MVGEDRPPAFRFNGGQKASYWMVVLGDGVVAASSYVLMFPFWDEHSQHANR